MKTIRGPDCLAAAYSLAWRLLLPPVLGPARLDGLLRSRTGRGFLPRKWRVMDRAGGEGAGGDAGPRSGMGALWLHCASLGEAKGLWAFAEYLLDAEGEGNPCGNLLLTASTDDGRDFLDRRCRERSGSPRAKAAIAPFDHPAVVRDFLRRHRMRGLCLYEAELWPHYLSACREAGLPVALVSGRMTANAERRYRRFGGAGARLLGGLAWIQAQSGVDADRFRRLTETPVKTGFDFKAAHFFRGRTGNAMPAPGGMADFHPVSAGPSPDAVGRPRFAFVSLHLAELFLFRKVLPDMMLRFDVTIFPRRMSQVDAFRRILAPLGFASHSRGPGGRHLLVDSLGRVGTLLPGCAYAFVGGSLIPKGCHNLWEPLLAGAGILFGPFRENQEPMARLLLERGVAKELADASRIGESLPADGGRAGTAAARASIAEALAEESRLELEKALADGRRRIIVTFFGNANGGSAADPCAPALRQTRVSR